MPTSTHPRQTGSAPLECSRHMRPGQSANWRPFLKWFASVMAATRAVAVSRLMLGTACAR
jgi:hypothetical protein